MEKSLMIQNNQVESFSEIQNRKQKIKEFLSSSQSKAENTVKGYCFDWADFQEWCLNFPVPIECLPVESENLAAYLVELANGERGKQIIRKIEAENKLLRSMGKKEIKITRLQRQVAEVGHKVSVIQRRLAAINRAHIMANLPSPTENIKVIDTMEKIRRIKTVKQDGKAALLTEDIKKIMEAMPQDSLKTVRDKALLLVGFAGAFRRSELVALNVEDVEAAPKGLLIRIRKSKTDQTGQGKEKALYYGANPEICPITALKNWLSHIESGPIFRAIDRHENISKDRITAQTVALVVKTAVEKAGFNKDKFSGHSLRVGFVTQADKNGSSRREIMKQTGHKDPKMIDRYIRDNEIFRSNAAENLGL